MVRWLAAVLIVPLVVVSVLAGIVVRGQNESRDDAISSQEIAALVTRINELDQALGEEALAGRLVIQDPLLWERFVNDQAAVTNERLADLESELLTQESAALGAGIEATKTVLEFRSDLRDGLVSPLQLADRYSVPRNALVAVLRENEKQVELRPLIALIGARSAHLDERISSELALTYGIWAPGQFNRTIQSISIQADRIGSIGADRSAALIENEQLLEYREIVGSDARRPQGISPIEFAEASDDWLEALNAEIEAEAEQISTSLEVDATNARRARTLTIIGVGLGVALAFLAALAVSLRVVDRVGRIAEFAERFATGERTAGKLSEVVKGKDELASLAVVFDAMAGAVETRDQRLATQADTDHLTGLSNRKAIRAKWKDFFAGRAGSAVAFALDLDGFKPINDLYGHHTGDMVLVEVANRLREGMNSFDAAVGRTGGDEFLVIWKYPEDARQTKTAIAEELLASIGRPIDVDGVSVLVGATIGIVTTRADGSTADGLLRDADAAMYVAKSGDRGRAVESTEELRLELAELEKRRLAINEGLENGEFEPWFQSVWNGQGRLVGFEALARWRTSDGVVHAAQDFITVLENQRLVATLDRLMLRRVCETIASWSAMSPYLPSVGTNISTDFLEEHSFVQTIKSVIEEFGINPWSLVLEVTESGLMTDAAMNATCLQEVRDLGVRVSVDDYGTGYSSLSYLRQLPVDFVKLDRLFVTNVDTDPKNQAIARSVLGLADDLGMATIAEGVEREEERAWLVANGAHSLQGYLLGKPVDAEQALDLFQTEVRLPRSA